MSDESTRVRLEELEARMTAVESRAAIIDVLNRYASSIDRRDWDAFASCFADRIELNLLRTPGWITKQKADYLVLIRRVFESYTATQHLSANHDVALDGAQATAWSTLNATHYLADAVGDTFHQQVGYYEYHLTRTDAWRIDRVRQVVSWQRGNQQIFDRTVS